MDQFENKLRFSLNVSKDDEGKKVLTGMPHSPSWSKLEESRIIEKHKNRAIITGSKNNITVIDFDKERGMEFYQKFEHLIKDTFIETSFRGYKHAYFEYDEDLKTTTNVNKETNIDILNDGKFCILGIENNGNPIIKIPQELKDFLLPRKKEIIKDNLITIDKIQLVLNNLSKDRADNYDDWLKIGAIIKYHFDSEDGFNLYNEYSKISIKYEHQAVIDKWESFDVLTSTVGSLFHMLSEDVDDILYRKIRRGFNSSPRVKKDKVCELKASEIKTEYIKSEPYGVAKLISEEFKDHDVADYFINKYNNYLYLDNQLYTYNGIYWLKSNKDDEITKLLSNEYFIIVDFIEKAIEKQKKEAKDNDKEVDETIMKFLTKGIKMVKFLRITSKLKGIVEAIRCKITILDDVFDKGIYLICFNNGTYDLQNDIFRENRLGDYITKCNDYDFRVIDENDESMILLNNFLNKVLPKKLTLNLLLLILSTTLIGKTLDKFVICTGAGGNAKDTLLTYLMPAVICDNYYKGNINTITTKCKSDLNVGLANCHKRNMVLFNEPAIDVKIITSQVKDITGGKSINARGLYQSNTNTKITATMLLCSNELPLLDTVDDAMERRLIVIGFNTLFKEQDYLDEHDIKEGLDADGRYYYLANKYFQSDEFIELVKLPMMNLLIQNFKIYKDNNYSLGVISQEIKDNNKKYMVSSDTFISWFNSEYEITNEIDLNTNYICKLKLKDLYQDYQESYLYENLTKQDKRTNNYKWFCEHISKNIYLRKYYKENIIDNVKQTRYRNVLINYKKIEKNEFDENE
tara:strand:- start:235 stop:2643 length:2409 start_codon:yes stop_codon:yes gene_type:complete